MSLGGGQGGWEIFPAKINMDGKESVLTTKGTKEREKKDSELPTDHTDRHDDEDSTTKHGHENQMGYSVVSDGASRECR
jgi:hypothetical protein